MLAARKQSIAFLCALTAPIVGCARPAPTVENAAQVPTAAPAKGGANQRVRVVLYAGLGAWPEGLVALRETFATAGFHVAETRGADFQPDGVDVLVVGGGWAPDQWKGFGAMGLERVRAFVQAGGGYVGICAGAYLASATVRWENRTYEYPLALFEGTAEGPRPGLVPWPNSGFVLVSRVGSSHLLQGSGTLLALYFGGSAFLAAPEQGTAMLRYPDGSVAALALQHGRGKVALLGPHLEVPNNERPFEASETRAFLRTVTRWTAAK